MRSTEPPVRKRREPLTRSGSVMMVFCMAIHTDGLGLVQDLTVNNKVSLENARILVLGAGGAVRGVLEPIIEQKA